jgi:hypothetical protein
VDLFRYLEPSKKSNKIMIIFTRKFKNSCLMSIPRPISLQSHSLSFGPSNDLRPKHATSGPLIGSPGSSSSILDRGAKPKLHGFLEKRGVGALGKGWKNRYFELEDDKLYYYEVDEDTKDYKGVINIEEITNISVNQQTNEPGWRFCIDTPTRRYDLRTTEGEYLMWYWIEGRFFKTR